MIDRSYHFQNIFTARSTAGFTFTRREDVGVTHCGSEQRYRWPSEHRSSALRRHTHPAYLVGQRPFYLHHSAAQYVVPSALSCLSLIAINSFQERTCFGTSLDRLVRLPGPIRASDEKVELLPQEQAINAPREIMRIVNWLMSNATDVVSQFLFFSLLCRR